jgi:hypothetical protein
MVQQSSEALAALYEADETAWLETTSDLVRRRRFDQIDAHSLSEYLADMARRDRREVESRLIVLLAHLLKWRHQPNHRTGGWKATIIEQRQELEGLLGRGVLWNHAEDHLADCYGKAVERAAAEIGIPAEALPESCPFTLERLLAGEIVN